MKHIQLTAEQEDKIKRVFEIFVTKFCEFYPKRKRLIKLSFIFYKILEFLNIDAKGRDGLEIYSLFASKLSKPIKTHI